MMAAVPPALCVLRDCTPIAHPEVWVVFVDRPVDGDLVAEYRLVVETGYLPGGPGHVAGVRTVIAATSRYGYIDYLRDSDLRPFVVEVPGTITLFVLPPDVGAVPPDGACLGGCLYTAPYHQLGDVPGAAYGVVDGFTPGYWNMHTEVPRWESPQLVVGAHELVEATAGLELADPCEGQAAPWFGYPLPLYRIGDACGIPQEVTP